MTGELRRSLRLPHLIFYGIGTMVGAGIYSVIGAAAGLAGHWLWASMLLAGSAAFLTALSYAELAALFPRAGAEYQFLRQAFPRQRLFSFLAGYLVCLSAAATTATVSLAFAGYLRLFLPLDGMIVAYGLIIACTVINIAGIREATWVSMGLISIEVAGLLLVIGVGIGAGDMGNAFREAPTGDQVPGIFAAAAIIFFVFIGFEDLANLTEETIAPRRTIPRALVGSMLITLALYMLVSVAALSLVTPGELAASDAPLATAVSAQSPALSGVLAVTAMFATASTALIGLVSMSRMLFGMARDGDMPMVLARVLPSRRTPWVAAIALASVAGLLLPLGTVRAVASVSSFAILLAFIAVQGALIVLRYRRPELERSFRVPGTIGRLPLLPVIGIAISAGLLTQFDPVVYVVGGLALAVGVAIHMLHRQMSG